MVGVAAWVSRWWNGPDLTFAEIPLEHGARHEWHDELRESRGFSQADLAEKLGCKQSSVARMENAKTCNPSVKSLIKIAQIFDVALIVRFGEWSVWVTKWGIKSIPPGFSSDQFLTA